MNSKTCKDTVESDLFTIEECDDINGEYAIFINCKMLRDFGEVKKNDEFEIIRISFQYGRFVEFINGENNISVPYKLVPDIK